MVDPQYETLLKVTWYYYVENYTQQNISDLLGISRAKVIRLLEEARQTGVIQFVFRKEDSERMSIEHRLMERFDLKDAFVIPAPQTDEELNDSIAEAAAMYISDHLREGGFINIGYGDTVGHLLAKLPNAGLKDATVVSLTGGSNYYLPWLQGGIGSLRLNLISAPLVVSKPELRDELMHEASIEAVYKMMEYADMSVVGIGGMDKNATVVHNGILTENEQTLLALRGAVGDVLNHFYDKDGNPIDSDIESRLISTSLETLQSFDNVIGVSSGLQKIPAIYAALNHNYINVLITDEKTAEALLNYESE